MAGGTSRIGTPGMVDRILWTDIVCMARVARRSTIMAGGQDFGGNRNCGRACAGCGGQGDWRKHLDGGAFRKGSEGGLFVIYKKTLIWRKQVK